jgi:hypothetical protein
LLFEKEKEKGYRCKRCKRKYSRRFSNTLLAHLKQANPFRTPNMIVFVFRSAHGCLDPPPPMSGEKEEHGIASTERMK